MVAQEERSEALGLFLRRANGTALICVNAVGRLTSRQRFTLAHEFGHFFLGHGSKEDTASTLRDAPENGPSSLDGQEVEANQFAAEFLCPVAAVTGWFAQPDESPMDQSSICRFAVSFGISFPAAKFRILKAEIADKSSVVAACAGLAQNPSYFLQASEGVRLWDELEDLHSSGAYPRMPAALVRRANQAREFDLIDEEMHRRLTGLDRPTPPTF